MNLFDVFPVLESERLVLRELTLSDAEALDGFIRSPSVYRYLPTFLFEQSYADTREMIGRARTECFDTKQSILFGVCLRTDPLSVIGLAEIYNYEPEKEKASIGYRLSERYWGRGIASESAALLKSYLLERTDVRKITAHVMAENAASARVLERNGFLLRWSGLREDWGRDLPVLINKYMYKLSPEEKKGLEEKRG